MITVLGLIAGALTSFSLFPQLFQILKTRHTKDLSLKAYVILTTGVFLWLIYGLLIKDVVVIIANVVAFVPCCAIVLLKLKHG